MGTYALNFNNTLQLMPLKINYHTKSCSIFISHSYCYSKLDIQAHYAKFIELCSVISFQFHAIQLHVHANTLIILTRFFFLTLHTCIKVRRVF